MSRDASLYRIVPSEVVRPENVQDMIRLLQFCSQHNRHVTFRAGGTSLSGQAIGSDILVSLARGWDSVSIHDKGASISLGPGVTGGHANAVLRPLGKKLGPDPASMNAAMIGGIVANNSSGMCCGTTENAYQTLTAIDVLLADGTRLDTADPDADEKLQATRPDLYQGILAIRDSVRNNYSLVERIRKKYSIKNTMGYSINAFLDEELPSQIIAKLMVGSEGTLGFIVNATFRTIADAKDKWTLFEVFPSLEKACDAAVNWSSNGAAAVELMDDASLTSFAALETTPEHYRITTPGAAALLVEYHNNQPTVDRRWTQAAKEQAILWHLRKGLMPTVGARRKSGETMINEDVAVSPHHLARLVSDVKQAFKKHGYEQAIIFGHAKDGNIHFVVNQRFDLEDEIKQYDRFMHDIAEIVVGQHHGSLKAEHGTGRNMAPFLEQEWGSDAVEIMRRVKQLLDPQSILNPGVLLNTDPKVHLQNIKPVPTVDAEVDRCIECGFCEHVCPTRDVTLTPRQRIVLQRELQLQTDPTVLNELKHAQRVQSINSCAVDGYCAVACPVSIDTGQLVKRLRSENHSTGMQRLATVAANRYGFVNQIASFGSRFILGRDQQTVGIELSGAHLPQLHHCFLPSCPSRWKDSGMQAMHAIATAANLQLHIPEHAQQLCCGQPFESQGFTQAHDVMVDNITARLKPMQQRTDSILVTDTNTCASALTHHLSKDGWIVCSAESWIHQFVLPRLTINKLPVTVAVHPGCGSAKLAEQETVLSVIQNLADHAFIPPISSCCGMGGGHGLKHPEVPTSAIQPMMQSIGNEAIDVLVTGNSFCAYAIEKYGGVRTMTVTEFVAMAITNGILDLST